MAFLLFYVKNLIENKNNNYIFSTFAKYIVICKN